MAITNPSFETVGALPGDADGWATSIVSTAWGVCPFGTDESGYEDFEVADWDFSTYKRLFFGVPTDLSWMPVETIYATGKTYEDFEEFFGMTPYYTTIPSEEEAVFDGRDSEWFSWMSPYTTGFLGVGFDLTAATFDAVQYEAFDWMPGYDTEFGLIGDLFAAQFFYQDSLGATTSWDSTETFERTRSAISLEGVSLPSTIYIPTGHGYSGTDQDIRVVRDHGTLPDPLMENVTYYGDNWNTDWFQVRRDSGGGLLTMTSVPEGVHTIVPSPEWWWTASDEDF